SLWGEVDKDITFEFETLWELDEKQEAEVRKINAETDKIMVEGGVLDPAEVRKKVAAEANSPYADIDVEDVPEPPQDEMMNEPAEQPGQEDGELPGASDLMPFQLAMAFDAWNESDHPRVAGGENAGQFTAGGGGGGGGSEKAKSSGGSKKSPGEHAS